MLSESECESYLPPLQSWALGSAKYQTQRRRKQASTTETEEHGLRDQVTAGTEPDQRFKKEVLLDFEHQVEARVDGLTSHCRM